MIITLYKFDKRIDSTARPNEEIKSVQLECNLKNDCSIVSPVIRIINIPRGNPAIEPFEYNYAYIEKFNRYYFTKDWKFVNNMWECELSVDVLASYKDNIVSSRQYVARAQVTVSNAVDVADGSALVLTESVNTTNSGDSLYRGGYSDGYFIVGIASPGANMGSIDYYLFPDVASFQEFTEKLLIDVSFYNIQDISQELSKCLVDPYKYIVSCKFFPFATAGLSTGVKTIQLGFWNLELSGQRLIDFSITKTIHIAVPKHPQKSVFGNFVCAPPYSEYLLEFEPFGAFTIDGSKLLNTNYIYCDLIIDLVTGEAKLKIRTDDDKEVYFSYGKLGIDFPIVGFNTDLMGTVLGFAGNLSQSSGEGWAKVGNSGLSSFMHTVAGVTNSYAEGSRAFSVRGSQNTRAFLTGGPKLHATFNKLSDEHIEKVGRAVCKNMSLSGLTGFVKCSNSVLNISCTETEYRGIIEFMDGGFYIE